MDSENIVKLVGYITVLFGTVGLLGEVSLYHRLLDWVNAWKADPAGGPSLGINLILAFVTMIPPLIIMIGLALLASGRETSEEEKSRDTGSSGGNGL